MQGNSLVLVLEYCCSDLAELIGFAATPFAEAFVKGIVQQLLQAIDACHQAGESPIKQKLHHRIQTTFKNRMSMLQVFSTVTSSRQMSCYLRTDMSSWLTLAMQDLKTAVQDLCTRMQ